jgi:putative ABC transport system permease protein
VNTLDTIAFARGALTRHRRRTLLCLLGVAVGVAAVILLTSLGEGGRRYVSAQFVDLGSNILILFPGRTETTGFVPGVFGTTHDLTLKDVNALERRVPNLRRIAPLAVGNDTVSWSGRRRQVAVLGTTSAMLDLRGLAIAAGEFLPGGPMERDSPVVVIGQKVAEELYPGTNPLGTVMRIGDFRMRVIGVLTPRGVHMGVDMDEIVIVPVATCMRMFDQHSLTRIFVETTSFGEIDAARAAALVVLAERHDGEEDVTCWTQDSVLGSLSQILSVLTYALGGIGAISLTVAGIGIMNVMLVSVSERTREIGLLKSLGARDAQIRTVFLAEAVLLSTTGGLAGLAIGWLVVRAIPLLFPSFHPAPPGWAVLSAVAVSVGVGAVFGLLPAAQATRLDPLSALSKR